MIALVADTVTAALNTFAAGAFTAQRLYVPRWTLAELSTVRVTVVPVTTESDPATRGKDSREVSLNIAVQKKLTDESESAVDVLVALAESIEAHLNRRQLDSGGVNMIWISSEHGPIFSAIQIEEKKVFTSVITVRYRVYQGI